MELIKKKILLENYVDRNYNSSTYGTVTATSFFINVMLEQDIDDMGLFTDTTYLPNFIGNNTPADYAELILKLGTSGLTFPFMFGTAVNSITNSGDTEVRLSGLSVSSNYSQQNGLVSGFTDTKIEDVRSYNQAQPFQLNFDINSEDYINSKGILVHGVDRVTSLGSASTYVFGGEKLDPNIGTTGQTAGIMYVDVTGTALSTRFYFNGEGWNETNMSLSAITKEEYLFGIISRPEIQSNVFIDRGISTVFENHLKLSEITNLGELSRYGKGYYRLIKQ